MPILIEDETTVATLSGLSGPDEVRTSDGRLLGPTHSPGVDEFVNQISGGKPFAEFEKGFFKAVRPTSLLKRFIHTEEVASLVAYVCSPLASATNGAALRVDGGVVQACF